MSEQISCSSTQLRFCLSDLEHKDLSEQAAASLSALLRSQADENLQTYQSHMFILLKGVFGAYPVHHEVNLCAQQLGSACTRSTFPRKLSQQVASYRTERMWQSGSYLALQASLPGAGMHSCGHSRKAVNLDHGAAYEHSGSICQTALLPASHATANSCCSGVNQQTYASYQGL
jgi:hypothetical protein